MLLCISQVLPIALTINNTRATIPSLMITNSGSLRFDIYSGPFTKNDQLTASPFADQFLYIPEVPAAIATNVLLALNNAGSDNKRSVDELQAREDSWYGLGYVGKRYMQWLEEMDRRSGVERRAAANQTLGYVTHDVS
jgi:hypothetical protein